METITEIRHRFALLIGVREYVDPGLSPLENTVNDVNGLENLLAGYGYTVIALHCGKSDAGKKPTRANIWAELNNIAGITEDGDLLLVHFGGHGVLARNRTAYLVPSDGRQSALEETAIQLVEFKRRIESAQAQARILFLDACHSGIGRQGAGMAIEFERQIFLQARGFATLAACRKGEKAYDHDTAQNGVFTYYILDGLNGAAARKSQRFVTFDDMKDFVTHSVKTWALHRGIRQWPNADSQLTGDPPLVDLEHRNKSFSTRPVNKKDIPPNPFSEMLAIQNPERFIGRQSEMRRLKSYLQGGSVALLGEPRIGKSSLLWQLAEQWEHDIIGPFNIDQLENRSGFFRFLAEILVLDNEGWEAIHKVLKNKKTLLLLDELDNSPNRGLTHHDFARFRALCEENREFKIVAVTRTPLKEIFPDIGKGSPFYNLLQPLTLGPLQPEDAHRLLEHPWSPHALTFDAHTREQIIAAAGCHPFKLQRAAFHCYHSLIDPSYHWHSAFQQDMAHML